MRQEFLSKCSSSEEGGHVFPNLVNAMCVSARTGHNIEVGNKSPNRSMPCVSVKGVYRDLLGRGAKHPEIFLPHPT